MPRGPRVHEIFSNAALDKSTTFKYDQQESIEQVNLSKKSVPAPVGPMKKFGAHKPKILSGVGEDEGGDMLVENGAGLSMEKALLKKKTSPAPDVPTSEPPAPRVNLTKPKPFVIGDKDVPMILSTVGDNENGDDSKEQNGTDVNGNLKDEFYDLHIYNTVSENGDRAPSLSSLPNSETSTLISPSRQDEGSLAFDNPALDDGMSSISEEHEQSLPTSSPPAAIKVNVYLEPQNLKSPSTTDDATTDDAFSPLGSNGNPDWVYIPDPDYDEAEQTMDFAEEDTDASDGASTGDELTPRRDRSKRSVVKQDQPLGHIYEGEDLSHYLSDDESPVVPVIEQTRNQKNRKAASKTLPRPPKINEKHSMFKPPPPSTKKKGSGKGKSPSFNNVRSFSYADSKFGTMSRVATSNSTPVPEYGDDSHSFLQSSMSYESFLRVRHGDAIPPPDSSDSGVDMDENFVQRRSRAVEPLWKKLTLRFKNRGSKDYSLKQN